MRVSRDRVPLLVVVTIALALLVAACVPAVERDAVVSATSIVSGVERVRLSGSSPQSLVPGPRGERMVYTAASGSSWVSFVVDVATRESIPFYVGPVAGFDWTPDGMGIVMSHWSANARSTLADRISLYDLASGSFRDITPSYRHTYGVPSVAPDGRRVIVTATDGDALADLAAALSGQKRETAEFFAAEFLIGSRGFTRTVPGIIVTSPNAYHPYEDRFVAAYRSPSSVSRSGVAEVDLASGDVNRLTPLLWSLRNISYSPSGEFVLYAARYGDDPSHIFALDRATTSLFALTEGNTSNTNPIWSADGYVYFFSDAGSSGGSMHETWRLQPLIR